MLPRHIAVGLERDISLWAERNKRDLRQTYEGRAAIVEELIEAQVRLNIPILTINLLRKREDIGEMDTIMGSIAVLFEKLTENDTIRNKQIRVSVFGKWYDLPSRPVEAIKKVLEETETYDQFFLNFCIYYDGREEIVDACQLIAMKIKAGKLDPESVSQELIKENLSTSYFMPPDIIIINGEKRLDGFMLWDASDSRIYFSNKDWPEFNAMDLQKAIELFRLVGKNK
jgi:undecaprenyl diphosphate synthase